MCFNINFRVYVLLINVKINTITKVYSLVSLGSFGFGVFNSTKYFFKLFNIKIIYFCQWKRMLFKIFKP
jgi:hypothetical protein